MLVIASMMGCDLINGLMANLNKIAAFENVPFII